jgi:hypothetical protein
MSSHIRTMRHLPKAQQKKLDRIIGMLESWQNDPAVERWVETVPGDMKHYISSAKSDLITVWNNMQDDRE